MAKPTPAPFEFSELLPLGVDDTQYRFLGNEGVSTFETSEGTFLKIDPSAIVTLTEHAMRDIAHLLRASHLQQLANIMVDPEASDNDRFVALDLLKNASISAGGVLPMCQDTGTAIVKGKKGQFVFTGGGDEEAISRGIYNTYLTSNLRYSQLAPLSMYEEVNTNTNLPAEIKISSVDGDEYKFLFMAKGGGSANKSYLFQETKALLNDKSLLPWAFEKMKTLGTAACPPYHLAIVIGGTSAENAVETAKLASAHYLDSLPTTGSKLGHAFRDLDLEQKMLTLSQQTGIGAQFGGKYFCHDVRVIRLPRHGASCPVAMAVSCSADRQALGKINSKGIFLEQLETDPQQQAAAQALRLHDAHGVLRHALDHTVVVDDQGFHDSVQDASPSMFLVASGPSGSLMVTRVPRLGVESINSTPPISVTSSLASGSPRPAP